MKWTIELAEKFLDMLSERDSIADAALTIERAIQAAYGTGDQNDEAELKLQAEIFVDAYRQGKAAIPPPTPPVAVPPPPPPMPPPALQNMVLDAGWWSYAPNTVGKMWTMRYDLRKFNLVGYGLRPSVKFRRVAKFPMGVGNVKTFRMYNDLDGPKYPNTYVALLEKEGFLYTENLAPFSVLTNHPNLALPVYTVGDGVEHDEVYQWQWPSDYGKADGKFRILIDGKIALSLDTWQVEGPGTDNAGKPVEFRGLPWDLFIQVGPSNPATVFPPDSFMKVKNVSIGTW